MGGKTGILEKTRNHQLNFPSFTGLLPFCLEAWENASRSPGYFSSCQVEKLLTSFRQAGKGKFPSTTKKPLEKSRKRQGKKQISQMS